MAVWAIGDIQGCLDSLERLLEKIGFDSSRDQLWFTGDLVNRGPDSVGVLRLVQSLGDSAICVLGNHDLHALAVLAGRRPAGPRDTLGDLMAAPDREELAHWMRHLPLAHHDSALGYLLVHAGVPPQWDTATALGAAREIENVLRGPHWREFMDDMYGNEPSLWSETLNGTQRLRYLVNALTRIRYVDGEGRIDLREKGAPGSQPAHLVPWFEAPSRTVLAPTVVFGHWSMLGALQAPGVIALDSGCLWGRSLTAVCLSGGSGSGALEFVSVSCPRYQAPRA